MDEASRQMIISKLKIYNNFPIPGIRFADIFPIFRSPSATTALVDAIVAHVRDTHELGSIHGIVCLEARGFYFAPLVASALELPCIPVRKKGKLPGKVITVTYEKDYGEDVLQMKDDSFEGVGEGRKEGKKVRVLLLDDLIALGGSAQAGKRLVEMLGGEVAECITIFEGPKHREIVNEKMRGTKCWSLIPLDEEILANGID